MYTYFDSFLPGTYKIGLIYNLVNSYFWICSSWPIFHIQLILLRDIFRKKDYPENFIDRCFNLFLTTIHILKENLSTVEKTFQLVLPYLGAILMQTRTKLRKSIKAYLTVLNNRLFLKAKINSVIIFA